MNLFPWFLFAHILGAIIAFGPTFSFPIIGRMSGAEPMHANFATRVSERLATIQLLPLAVVQAFTGIGLIITGNIDVTKAPWLVVAVIIYLVAIGYGIFVQTPLIRKVIAMTSRPPAGLGATGPGGQPAAGPPPELVATIKRVKQGGMFLAVAVVSIAFLMVVKPF